MVRDMPRWLLPLLFFVTLADAGLKQQLKQAGFDYPPMDVQCAACEAVAQGLERSMATGKHLGKGAHKRMGDGTVKAASGKGDGAVERLEVLYSVCATLMDVFPAHLEHGDTFHFFYKEGSGAKGHVAGLVEYCEELVEAYEAPLLETMRQASPIDVPKEMNVGNKGVLRYELKDAVCVRATVIAARVEARAAERNSASHRPLWTDLRIPRLAGDVHGGGPQ